MLLTPLTPKAVIIVFIFGVLLLLDRGCAETGQSVTEARGRHSAAMKDLGTNDQVPVRSPWGDALK